MDLQAKNVMVVHKTGVTMHNADHHLTNKVMCYCWQHTPAITCERRFDVVDDIFYHVMPCFIDDSKTSE